MKNKIANDALEESLLSGWRVNEMEVGKRVKIFREK